MENRSSQKQAEKIRDILTDACRTLIENLDREMKYHLARHPDRYQKRYDALMKVLMEFETNPCRLDSSFNTGLAEKIYYAVPAEMLYGFEIDYFKLKATNCDKHPPSPFGLYDLALAMEDAYRSQSFSKNIVFDPDIGEITSNNQIDPICDELTAFFGMIQNPLKNLETDYALKYIARYDLSYNELTSLKFKEDVNIENHEKKTILRLLGLTQKPLKSTDFGVLGGGSPREATF